MNEQMKGIACCGDCAYYDWKKHRCPRAKVRGNSQSRFYVDCPLHDVRPVVRGKWIEFDEDSWECSNCGQLWTLNDGTPKENNMNYCPNCGAEMRGGELNG